MPPPGTVRYVDTPELFQQNQLRQRKLLPPLASPPTELSMDAFPLSAANPVAPEGVNEETKSEMEQVLGNHTRFARAFKLNDAAMLLPFLDKGVTLTTSDGHVVEGVSAVLGCLVGNKMSKLSGALHVKGRPTRSAPWQSAFVYEHGLVFKEPLYSELVDWKPHSSVVTKITHTRLSHPLESGPPKSVADVVKVVATLPHRLSLSDEDDFPQPQLQYRHSSLSSASSASASASAAAQSSTASAVDGNNHNDKDITTSSSNSNSTMTTSSIVNTTTTSSSSSISSSTTTTTTTTNGSGGNVVVTRLAVLSNLSPIRKRKLVNAFLTVESANGAVLWKSAVAKKQTMPVWRGVWLDIPSSPLPSTGDTTHVVVTLWDHGFLRSLRVATAHVTAAQLLRDQRDGLSILELKPMGLSTQPVVLSLAILPLDEDGDWKPRSRRSSLNGINNDATTEDVSSSSEDDTATTMVKTQTKWPQRLGFFDLDPFAVENPWLVVAVSVLALLLCSAALYLHSLSYVVDTE